MKQYTMDQRYALMTEWEQSGKTINQFCRDKNLKATIFHGWRQRYKGNPQPFTEISVIAPINSSL